MDRLRKWARAAWRALREKCGCGAGHPAGYCVEGVPTCEEAAASAARSASDYRSLLAVYQDAQSNLAKTAIEKDALLIEVERLKSELQKPPGEAGDGPLLSSGERERLAHLIEELSEAQWVAARILVCGYAAAHGKWPLRNRLETELGHVLAALAAMAEAGDVRHREIAANRCRKQARAAARPTVEEHGTAQ